MQQIFFKQSIKNYRVFLILWLKKYFRPYSEVAVHNPNPFYASVHGRFLKSKKPSTWLKKERIFVMLYQQPDLLS